MRMKKYLCLILSVILCFVFMCGCSNQGDKNENNFSNVVDNTETQAQTEEPTKEMITYMKNGFFSPTLFQSEEMITAVVEGEEIWAGEFESEEDIYFVEFADLNFDGQLEFIVTDNLYPDDFYFHANAYYLENGRLVKATVVNELNDVDGYLNDYVCTFDNGKEITPNYLSRTFHKIIKKTNLPMIRFHDLRHSVASNLLNDGFTTVQVAEWLGHSSSTTTLKFYAHIDKTSKMAIANSLARV